MELNKQTIKKILFIIFISILMFTGIQKISKILILGKWCIQMVFPFILGACMAFILNVPMRAIERRLFSNYSEKHEKTLKKICRPISLVLTFILVIGLILVIVFMVAPQLGDTLMRIYGQIPDFFNNVQAWINNMSRQYDAIDEFIKNSGLAMDLDKMAKNLLTFIQSFAGNLFASTVGVAASIVNGIVSFAIGLIFAIYILLEKEDLGENFRKLFYAYLPEKKVDYLINVVHLSDRVFSKFLTGQCLDACILGIMFVIAMSIFKMPYALLIGVVIAFTALIPIVGAFIGCVFGVLLIMLESPIMAIWFVVMFLVLQQLEANLVYPKVVGNSVGLPAIWVLFAVTVGGNVMGVTGMLLFIPLSSIVYSILRDFVAGRLKKRGIPTEKFIAKKVLPDSKKTKKSETEEKDQQVKSKDADHE